MRLKKGCKDIVKPLNMGFSNVTAFFTTKVSGDIIEFIAKRNNISKDSIYLPVQRHTNKIHVLEADLRPVVADAVITGRKGTLIGVLVADCVPILLYDRTKQIVGVVHAGWRGTAKGILKDTIKNMSERFDSSAGDILVAMGPSIRQCCYEVDVDIKTAIQDATGRGTYYYERDNRYFVGLSSANKIQALSSGVPLQNIWLSEECTSCNPDKFHSYRYTKNSAGRQGGFIGMW